MTNLVIADVNSTTRDLKTTGDGTPGNPHILHTNDVTLDQVLETTDRGGKGLAIFVQDQTTGVLDVPFLQTLSMPTLAADTVVDVRTITLSPGHGLVNLVWPAGNVGNIMELADPSNGSFFTQSAITSIVGDVVTLDTPINRVYLAATALVAVSNNELNVDGSVTPVVFSILPFSAQAGDMVRTTIDIQGIGDMDFSTFGHLPALTNGCVLRINNGDGTYRNLYNFKSNDDIIEQAFDHAFLLPKGPNTTRGFAARITWGGQSKRGVVIRLDGSINESLELIVQDDLRGLVRLHWTGNGSEIQGII